MNRLTRVDRPAVDTEAGPVETVEITGHRGSCWKAPENTLPAVRQAIADGCDYIELDVQTSADGAVVVVHDRDLMRVAGDRRRVENLTLAELKQVDVGRQFAERFTGEQVPTLAEVIQLVRGNVRLNVELKYNRPDPRLVPAVLRVLHEERFLDQCLVTSLNSAAVQAVKASKPSARVGLIVRNVIGRLPRVDIDALSVAVRRATPAFIRAAHRAGRRVHVWTVNKPEIMVQLIENGADNIISDRPDVLRTVLEKRTRVSDSEELRLRLRSQFGDGSPM